MKYLKLLPVLFICALFAFSSCGDSKADARKQQARDALGTPTPPPTANPAAPTTAEPAQNAAGVWHYICNNGCAGGAGAQGTCPTCGGQLAHNSAYHNNTATATPNPVTPPITQPSNNSLTAPMTPPITPPKAPEPAQNAAGVWHYTCANGCAGGAGAKGTCSKCGGSLTHNQAYHQ